MTKQEKIVRSAPPPAGPASGVLMEHLLVEGARSAGDMMARMARIVGCEIETRGLVSVVRSDTAVLAAPIVGVPAIDPVDYARGVDTSFVYLRHARKPHIRPGFYRMRSVADIREIGITKGVEQLVSETGAIVAQWRAEFDTFALHVPEDSRGTLVLGLGLHADSVQMDKWCSNGTHTIVFDDEIVNPG